MLEFASREGDEQVEGASTAKKAAWTGSRHQQGIDAKRSIAVLR
jgi:hypothetical protein